MLVRNEAEDRGYRVFEARQFLGMRSDGAYHFPTLLHTVRTLRSTILSEAPY